MDVTRAPLAHLATSSAVRRLVLGLVVVVADLRVEGFDLLVDTVGWVVVLGALAHLARVVPEVRTARAVAVLAAVLSVADLLHPTRTAVEDLTGDGALTTSTTTVVEPVGLQGALTAGYAALCVAFLVLLCLALAVAAAREGRAQTATRLRTVAWTTAALQGGAVVLGAVSQLTGTDAPGAGPELVALALLLAVGGFATAVWVLVTLWGLRTWPLLVSPSDSAVRR